MEWVRKESVVSIGGLSLYRVGTADDAVRAASVGNIREIDMGARVLAKSMDADEQEWTPAEDRQLLRKVDFRLLPILLVCTLISSLDKVAISAAAIYGLQEDLHLSGTQYSWCGSAPYIGGLVFAPATAYLLKQLPPNTFFAANIFLWGIMALLITATRNFAELFVCRFFLGGFEAVVIPVGTLIISQWYKTSEQPLRNSIIFNVTSPIFNGFVAWTVSYNHSSFPGWKIIFLSIGGFTILWSVVTLFFLPRSILEAPWLSDRQRCMLIKRKAGDNTGVESPIFRPDHVKEALLDVKTWLLWVAVAALQLPNGGLTAFNTLIIQGLGFDNMQTSLLAMPPGVMATVSGILCSYAISQTRRYRIAISAASALMPLTGVVLCYTLPRSSLAGQLIGLYVLYTYWAPYVTLIGIYQANIAGHTKKITMYAIIYVAYAAGNIIGPQTFREDQAPAYNGGKIAIICAYVVAIAAELLYWLLCHRSNVQRREAIAEKCGEFDWCDLTDKENEAFRYTT